MLTRVLVGLALLALGCGDDRFVVDDKAAAAQITAFYSRDPAHYWARYGIPTLVRSSFVLSESGLDGMAPFGALARLFDATRFSAAAEAGELPQDVVSEARAIVGADATSWQLYVAMNVVLVERLDLARLTGAGYADPAAITAVAGIRQVFLAAFSGGAIDTLVPGGAKPEVRELTVPRDVCMPGTDTFSDQAAAAASDPATGEDDHNTERSMPWRDVTTGDVWKTTYNGACATLAAGACAAKLGLGGFDDTVSCELWNLVSNEVRDPNRPTGGTLGGLERFFAGRGYCTRWASDGPFESACEEALKALQRGCNVDLIYYDPGGGAGHGENVDQIVVDPTSSERCTVHTLSWGMQASVTVDSGRYSGKSDGHRYGNESFLMGSGPATFMYFCPCEDK